MKQLPLALLTLMLTLLLTASASALGLNVSYTTPTCGEPITFTLEGYGGTGNYEYMLNCIYNGDYEYVIDPSWQSYQTENVFQITLYIPDKYEFHFYVMDMENRNITREIVPLNVDGSNYPSLQERVQSLAKECLAAGCETDYDKALWLHDWLVANCTYDNSMTYCNA